MVSNVGVGDLMHCPYVEHGDLFKLKKDNCVLNVMHLNIRSLPKHGCDLSILLDEISQNNVTVDAIALCETYLTSTNEYLGKLHGYQLINSNHQLNSGGGVALLIHNSFDVVEKIKTPWDEKIFESVFVKIRKANFTCIIGEFYRAPGTNTELFLQHYDVLAETLMKYNKLTVVCSDQNLNLLKSNLHGTTKNFIKKTLDMGLIPAISKPTRVTKTSSTLIDNMYVRLQRKSDCHPSVIVDDISDHFPCFVSITNEMMLNVEPLHVIKSRKLTDDKLLKINHELLWNDWNSVYKLNVCDAYDFLVKTIYQKLDNVAPFKVLSVPSKQVFTEPLLTVKLLKLNRKCKKLYKRSLSCSDRDVNIYKQYRNTLQRLKKSEKLQYYKKLFEKVKSNSKNMWSCMNSLIKKQNDKTCIKMLYDKETSSYTTDTNVISERLNCHFTEIGKKVQGEINKKNMLDYKQYIRYQFKKALLTVDTNEIEITNIVSRLKVKYSSGKDGISNDFMKKIINSIREPWCVIFNRSLNTGIFPTAMKEARVKPLFKSGDTTKKDNYRPISLLPVFSKVLEKIVYKRVVSQMDDNAILFIKQFGFRKKHSTVDAIETLVGNILEGFENDMACLSIFIDLRKAFDTVNHAIILEKLRPIGIQGTLLLWFESYLNKRSQYTEIGNDAVSTKKEVSTGVPQGSLLGVLLFQLIINDMKNCLKHTTAIIYADDTTLFVIGKNVRFLEKKLQTDLNSVSMWLKANYLCLNETKTKIILFNKQGIVNFYEPKIIINGISIEMVESFKFLGITIDRNLDWNTHSELISKRLLQSLFVLNRVKQLIPLKCMKMLYYAYFDSHISYAMPVWYTPLSTSMKSKLFLLQKRAVHIVTNRSYRDHTDPLFNQTKILKLADKERIELCKLMYKIINQVAPRPVCNLYQFIHKSKTQSGGLIVKPHKSKYYNTSFLNKGVIAWNSLSQKQKEKQSVTSFVKSLKTVKY